MAQTITTNNTVDYSTVDYSDLYKFVGIPGSELITDNTPPKSVYVKE